MTELSIVGEFDTLETQEDEKNSKNPKLTAAIKTLKKIYNLFSDKKPAWDIPEISEKLGLPGGATAKYCKVLLTLGLIKSERTLVRAGVRGDIAHNTFSLAEDSPAEKIEEVTPEVPEEVTEQ